MMHGHVLAIADIFVQSCRSLPAKPSSPTRLHTDTLGLCDTTVMTLRAQKLDDGGRPGTEGRASHSDSDPRGLQHSGADS